MPNEQTTAVEAAKQTFRALAEQTGYNVDQLVTISKTVAKGATMPEFQMFMYVAKRSGLDPFLKQIYFQKRNNRKTGEATVTIQVGIDGYRTIAARTGEYAGNDDPVYDDEKNPKKATATVYRIIKGVRCPFSATARWDQYYPGDALGFMWKKMPHLMLGKCAEALALRKAFPAELAGLYTHEEMQQAGGGSPIDAEVVDIQTPQAPKTPQDEPEEPRTPQEPPELVEREPGPESEAEEADIPPGHVAPPPMDPLVTLEDLKDSGLLSKGMPKSKGRALMEEGMRKAKSS